MTPRAVDPDEVVRVVLACPDVASMSEGAVAEVASYLPGRRVPGVRLGEEGLEVHIVARWGRPLPEIGEAVRTAVAPVAGASPVTVFVDDVEMPAEGAPPSGSVLLGTP